MVDVFLQQEHPWVTRGGKCPLPSTKENCPDIEVTDDDIKNSVRAIPKIKTLVRIILFTIGVIVILKYTNKQLFKLENANKILHHCFSLFPDSCQEYDEISHIWKPN